MTSIASTAARSGAVAGQRRLRLLGGVALASASLLATGCGRSAGGDPGGRRLQELNLDRVFAALPAGAALISRTRTAARYNRSGFTGGGWHGPSVVLTFRSSAVPGEVYRFYARRAATAGWRGTARGALGRTDAWAKTYPDGASATLLLSALIRPQSASGRLYILSGGVSPIVH
jgi:hypothetical protein